MSAEKMSVLFRNESTRQAAISPNHQHHVHFDLPSTADENDELSTTDNISPVRKSQLQVDPRIQKLAKKIIASKLFEGYYLKGNRQKCSRCLMPLMVKDSAWNGVFCGQGWYQSKNRGMCFVCSPEPGDTLLIQDEYEKYTNEENDGTISCDDTSNATAKEIEKQLNIHSEIHTTKVQNAEDESTEEQFERCPSCGMDMLFFPQGAECPFCAQGSEKNNVQKQRKRPEIASTSHDIVKNLYIQDVDSQVSLSSTLSESVKFTEIQPSSCVTDARCSSPSNQINPLKCDKKNTPVCSHANGESNKDVNTVLKRLITRFWQHNNEYTIKELMNDAVHCRHTGDNSRDIDSTHLDPVTIQEKEFCPISTTLMENTTELPIGENPNDGVQQEDAISDLSTCSIPNAALSLMKTIMQLSSQSTLTSLPNEYVGNSFEDRPRKLGPRCSNVDPPSGYTGRDPPQADKEGNTLVHTIEKNKSYSECRDPPTSCTDDYDDHTQTSHLGTRRIPSDGKDPSEDQNASAFRSDEINIKEHYSVEPKKILSIGKEPFEFQKSPYTHKAQSNIKTNDDVRFRRIISSGKDPSEIRGSLAADRVSFDDRTIHGADFFDPRHNSGVGRDPSDLPSSTKQKLLFNEAHHDGFFYFDVRQNSSACRETSELPLSAEVSFHDEANDESDSPLESPEFHCTTPFDDETNDASFNLYSRRISSSGSRHSLASLKFPLVDESYEDASAGFIHPVGPVSLESDTISNERMCRIDTSQDAIIRRQLMQLEARYQKLCSPSHQEVTQSFSSTPLAESCNMQHSFSPQYFDFGESKINVTPKSETMMFWSNEDVGPCLSPLAIARHEKYKKELYTIESDPHGSVAVTISNRSKDGPCLSPHAIARHRYYKETLSARKSAHVLHSIAHE